MKINKPVFLMPEKSGRTKIVDGHGDTICNCEDEHSRDTIYSMMTANLSPSNIQAEAVMSFVNMIRGAFSSGFVDNNPTVYDIYRSAQNHVKDNYGIDTENWDDELANTSRNQPGKLKQLINDLDKAVKTLKNAGFEDKGGEYWQPPVNKCAGETIQRLLASEGKVAKSLSELLEHYCGLINSGDAGNWDPEEEQVVIDARAALSHSKYYCECSEGCGNSYKISKIGETCAECNKGTMQPQDVEPWE